MKKASNILLNLKQMSLHDRCYAFFATTLPIAFAIATHHAEELKSVNPFYTVIFMAICFAFIAHSIFYFFMYKPNEKFLENVIESLYPDLLGVFDLLLFRFAENKLGFKSGGKNSDRITIYIHEASHNRFVPFGRYSQNPEFSKRRRRTYPDNEGCIAEGWLRALYVGKGERYPINKKDLKDIRMKSKFYAVKRIDLGNKKLAVLVVESEKSNRFTKGRIREILEDESKEFIYHLAQLIEKLYYNIPTPSYAEGVEQ